MASIPPLTLTGFGLLGFGGSSARRWDFGDCFKEGGVNCFTVEDEGVKSPVLGMGLGAP
jgi:hypothetical protein